MLVQGIDNRTLQKLKMISKTSVIKAMIDNKAEVISYNNYTIDLVNDFISEIEPIVFNGYILIIGDTSIDVIDIFSNGEREIKYLHKYIDKTPKGIIEALNELLVSLTPDAEDGYIYSKDIRLGSCKLFMCDNDLDHRVYILNNSLTGYKDYVVYMYQSNNYKCDIIKLNKKEHMGLNTLRLYKFGNNYINLYNYKKYYTIRLSKIFDYVKSELSLFSVPYIASECVPDVFYIRTDKGAEYYYIIKKYNTFYVTRNDCKRYYEIPELKKFEYKGIAPEITSIDGNTVIINNEVKVHMDT